MNKQPRVLSAKPNTNNRNSNQTIGEQLSKEISSRGSDSKFKKRYEVIRSARDRSSKKISNHEPVLQQFKDIREQSSKSKFLQKFDNIRSSRQNLNQSEEDKQVQKIDKQKEIFQYNKKQMYIDSKFNNIKIETSLIVPFEYASKNQDQMTVKLHKNARIPHNDLLKTRPASGDIEYVNLAKVSSDQLIFKKQEEKKSEEKEKSRQQLMRQKQKDNYITAYWKRQNKFVSLIPLKRNQRLDFQHNNILQIYGEITIKDSRYVISDQYKNCSLKNLMQQFGPFNQQLGKRYLKQIALGLQHMHFKKRGHNRLNIRNILYNKNGELFINSIHATSLALTKQEFANSNDLHFYAPQFLMTKGCTKSLKNDVWALGCLAILMITSTGLRKSQLHPYNWLNFKDKQEETMVDNVKQLHGIYFNETKLEQNIYKGQNIKEQIRLSQIALHFISSCLEVVSQRRATISNLLQHQFFQGI